MSYRGKDNPRRNNPTPTTLHSPSDPRLVQSNHSITNIQAAWVKSAPSAAPQTSPTNQPPSRTHPPRTLTLTINNTPTRNNTLSPPRHSINNKTPVDQPTTAMVSIKLRPLLMHTAATTCYRPAASITTKWNKLTKKNVNEDSNNTN